MEDQSPYENQKKKLSSDETKEKILLDIYYLKSQINSNIDKINIKEIKKNISQLENNLIAFLQIDVPLKSKKDYVNLKNTNFDNGILKLAKYLK
jgi:hypothetical protein